MLFLVRHYTNPILENHWKFISQSKLNSKWGQSAKSGSIYTRDIVERIIYKQKSVHKDFAKQIVLKWRNA